MKLILQEKGNSSEGRYISIRSDFTSADAINHIQITPDFMRDFAGIKNKVSDAYPEFSNNTVLNKLISVSPNIRSGSKKRKLEEKPEFRTAESDLEVNSIPKKLHDGETKSSMIFRTILIGNSERNSRLEALTIQISKKVKRNGSLMFKVLINRHMVRSIQPKDF